MKWEVADMTSPIFAKAENVAGRIPVNDEMISVKQKETKL
jgi:hypothetical protein